MRMASHSLNSHRSSPRLRTGRWRARALGAFFCLWLHQYSASRALQLALWHHQNVARVQSLQTWSRALFQSRVSWAHELSVRHNQHVAIVHSLRTWFYGVLRSRGRQGLAETVRWHRLRSATRNWSTLTMALRRTTADLMHLRHDQLRSALGSWSLMIFALRTIALRATTSTAARRRSTICAATAWWRERAARRSVERASIAQLQVLAQQFRVHVERHDQSG